MPVPADLVEVGHISGAYGIRGWVRIRPYSADAEVLLTVRKWWLNQPEWQEAEVLEARWHGSEIIAQLMGIADRDAAEARRGAVVHVSRRRFPVPDDGEYYWVDLIGLDVFNKREELLGTVTGVMDNGVHAILKVAAKLPDGSGKELLIPFIDVYVGEVDRKNKRISADWELDY